MILTINSLVEAMKSHGARMRTLEVVRLLDPEPRMPGRGLVDFEVSVGGVECLLRCPLRTGGDVRGKLRAMADGWRLLENELVVFDPDGRAVAIDVLVRPMPVSSDAPREAVRGTFEEYVWDPVWGVAAAMEDGRWWLLDGDGRVLNPAPFDWLGEVSEGMIVAQRGRLFGYIDTAGREVVPFVYSDANSFSGGRALVERDGKSFYISSPRAARMASEKEYSI